MSLWENLELSIYAKFVDKIKKNVGLILFSHSLIEKNGIINLVSSLLEDHRVKKIKLLEVEEVRLTGRISPNKIVEINTKLSSRKIYHSEFLRCVEEGKVDPFTIYEIVKVRYY